MIFDTDIFIWVQRKNKKSADLIDKTEDRYLSVQSYMELLQCARDKGQQRLAKQFISDVKSGIRQLFILQRQLMNCHDMTILKFPYN